MKIKSLCGDKIQGRVYDRHHPQSGAPINPPASPLRLPSTTTDNRAAQYYSALDQEQTTVIDGCVCCRDHATPRSRLRITVARGGAGFCDDGGTGGEDALRGARGGRVGQQWGDQGSVPAPGEGGAPGRRRRSRRRGVHPAARGLRHAGQPRRARATTGTWLAAPRQAGTAGPAFRQRTRETDQCW